MKISISIPTHNRAEEVRLTLQSLARIKSDQVDNYEVLVIGNACTDHTAEVVKSFVDQFNGKLRFIEEERLGLNHARNRAFSEARFPLVAFLDDDVDVDPDWLRGLSSAFRSETCAAVGGKAYLVYPISRPKWLGDEIEGLLSKVDHGAIRQEATAEDLFGLNLTIKKDWFGRIGMFRTDLDRTGNCLISGGETEFLERIVRVGGRLIYEPSAIVGHRVPKTRLRRMWFWSRCYWGGVGSSRIVADEKLSLRSLRRPTAHMILTSASLIGAVLRKGPRSPEAFYQSTRWVGYLGCWLGTARRVGQRFLGARKRRPHNNSLCGSLITAKQVLTPEGS